MCFKGINTSFVDLVPEATNPDRQVAGGVTAYARQTISSQGTVSASSVSAAIVRFHWVGESEAVADGKKSATNLHILMNWQKRGADWKLLSRASTKL
jgi:hypothetical protein